VEEVLYLKGPFGCLTWMALIGSLSDRVVAEVGIEDLTFEKEFASRDMSA
jgi:hypothetical protein